MSPFRRRSARLAGLGSKPTPKVTPQLVSLAESDEPATASALLPSKPQSPEDLMKRLPPTPTHLPTPRKPLPATPTASSAVKPPHSEMHPSKARHATRSLSPGLNLGFADIKTANMAKTPSKITMEVPRTEPVKKSTANHMPPASPFTFRFSSRSDEMQLDRTEQGDLGLGSEAMNVMRELRGEAAKIMETMVAQKKAEDRAAGMIGEEGGRRFAKPKGKSSRFSAAHMVEFKKMDSIAGHASAFRATPGRFNPVTGSGPAFRRSPSKPNLGADDDAAAPSQPGLERSQSKASLNDREPGSSAGSKAPPPSLAALKRTLSKANPGDVETPALTPAVAGRGLKRTISKANLHEKDVSTPSSSTSSLPRSTLKRARSKANLNGNDMTVSVPSPRKPESRIPAPADNGTGSSASVKRVKQRLDDDASTHRPGGAVADENSSIPRPKSSGNDSHPLARSRFNPARPTASTLARTGAPGSVSSKPPGPHLLKPSPGARATGSEARSPDAKKLFDPVSFEEVRANIRARLVEAEQEKCKDGEKDKEEHEKQQSSIPVLSVLQTPATTRIDRVATAPSVLSATTPGRSLFQRLHGTPKTVQAPTAIELQNSPTPVKVGTVKGTTGSVFGFGFRNTPLPKDDKPAEVTYPDLSKHKETHEPIPKAKLVEFAAMPAVQATQSFVPGTFSFRSDHTIKFDTSPSKGFGATHGQSSLRHVRDSLLSAFKMPGGFPEPLSNKENNGPENANENDKPPAGISDGIPHGIKQKKRARPSWKEEEAEQVAEEVQRAAKKHKRSHPVAGDPFTAPRTVHAGAAASVPTSSPVRQVPQTPNQASPAKKKPFLSVSRLNKLAQPKIRR